MTPSDTMQRRRGRPAMTASRAALVALMHRYLGGLLHPAHRKFKHPVPRPHRGQYRAATDLRRT
jgi:hypothetical protein